MTLIVKRNTIKSKYIQLAVLAAFLVLGLRMARRSDEPRIDASEFQAAVPGDAEASAPIMDPPEEIGTNPHGVTADKIRRFQRLQMALTRNNPAEIATFFSMPYGLPSPLPPIESPEEFVARIDEVLDATVRSRILKADPVEDLARMGWRGIMLYEGLVWFREEEMKIFAINHRTATFKAKRDRQIEDMRTSLHPSLREFLEPVMEKETHSRRFRVDLIEGEGYRYAVWPIEKTFADEPSLVLYGGRMKYWFEGRFEYRFTTASYEYSIRTLSADHPVSPSGYLLVFRDDDMIFREYFP